MNCSSPLSVTLIFLLFLFSCKPAPNPKADFFNWTKKGEVITVSCKVDINNTYSLYLPSNYNLERTWPLVYCFDPHGDGNLPIELLKEFAGKEGYILVGSNSSRNGLNADELSYIIDKLIEDTRNKFNVDEKRIYALGFSGGARVACSLALTYGNIAGIIACSAGYRPSVGQPSFNFVGIAGSLDMNCQEMKQLNYTLNSFLVRHELLIFNDKHKWPPKELIVKALQDLEIMNMADRKIYVNDSLLNLKYNKADERINLFAASANLDSIINVGLVIDNEIQVFKGLKDISKWEMLEKKLQNYKTYINALDYNKKIEIQEAKNQLEYANAIQSQSIGWWMDEIKRLNAIKSKNAASPESQSAYRLLAYISLMSYSYVNSAINQHDWQSACHILKIYGLADPENPDYYYFNACYLTNTGKGKEAYEAIVNAIKFGFSDKNKLQNDPLLEVLRKEYNLSELMP